MNSDFAELLRTFNDNDVRYPIVGGYAVVPCAEPRFPKAPGIGAEAGAEKAARGWPAPAESGGPLTGVAVENKRGSGRHIDLHEMELLS